tara:strand:+ start:12350 stop:13534 length:1185 start_codon:yes stop_codon:yes gene_type:complete
MSKFSYLYEDPVSSGDVVGETPHGIYDTDGEFQNDSLTVCKYVARKLGHPVMQLEYDKNSIYACFEEAISEYSQQINHYNTRNWLWEHYGSTDRISGSALGDMGSHEPESPHMGLSVTIAEQYGEAVGVGGGVTMYTGSVTLEDAKQTYDLQSEANLTGSHSSERLEIQKVFNYGPAAVTKFYDPYAGSFDQQQMLDNFGMGDVAPAVTYIMRPVSHDITRAQAIETSDKIRKSAYSFELINNKLRIFPKPKSDDAGEKIYFHYYLKTDKGSTTRTWTNSKVSDPSNIPYKFITYNEINAAGRNWIRKFTLALSKELLGIIRSKYANMPLPTGDVTLDGESLKAEGREEKEQLLTELKEFLDSVSLAEGATKQQEQADAQQAILNKAPLGIFIG